MANEVIETYHVKGVKGNLAVVFDPPQIKTDMGNSLAREDVVTVGTSEEDLDPGDVTTANQGVLIAYNLDNTNYVTYGPKSAGAMVLMGKILPKEMHRIRFADNTVVLRWKANAAPVNVQIKLLSK